MKKYSTKAETAATSMIMGIAETRYHPKHQEDRRCEYLHNKVTTVHDMHNAAVVPSGPNGSLASVYADSKKAVETPTYTLAWRTRC